MNCTMARAALAFSCLLGASAAGAGDVNVGVTISGEIQPGVYGRIDIGNRPPPPVVYPQPVWIVQPPQPVVVAPVYLHVPPGHAKNWAKHCARYNACNTPVYFVRSAEYDEARGHEGKRGHGKGRGHGRGD